MDRPPVRLPSASYQSVLEVHQRRDPPPDHPTFTIVFCYPVGELSQSLLRVIWPHVVAMGFLVGWEEGTSLGRLGLMDASWFSVRSWRSFCGDIVKERDAGESAVSGEHYCLSAAGCCLSISVFRCLASMAGQWCVDAIYAIRCFRQSRRQRRIARSSPIADSALSTGCEGSS